MEERSAHGGTFVGNPISMIAGIATLDTLQASKIYEKINSFGEKIREGLQSIIEGSNISASVTGVGSTFALHFTDKPPKTAREMASGDAKLSREYYHHMLEKNIAYMSPNISHCWICEPHTLEDVNEYLSATEMFFINYK
jgi:glutamate-1-semialdehyde 2,1-aminomutase